jgi:hypothetical protein
LDGAPWARDAIRALYENGVIDGVTDELFRPDADLTRAELVKLLVSLFAGGEQGGGSGFADVTADDWFCPYVAFAERRGLVNGYGGYFRPDDPVTREDAAALALRFMRHADAVPEDTGKTVVFTDDGDIAEYAREAVGLLAQREIVNGFADGRFLPKNFATRAEMAKILYLANRGAGE